MHVHVQFSQRKMEELWDKYRLAKRVLTNVQTTLQQRQQAVDRAKERSSQPMTFVEAVRVLDIKQWAYSQMVNTLDAAVGLLSKRRREKTLELQYEFGSNQASDANPYKKRRGQEINLAFNWMKGHLENLRELKGTDHKAYSRLVTDDIEQLQSILEKGGGGEGGGGSGGGKCK